MKIRVTIDTDKCDFEGVNENSYQTGVVSLDVDGVGRWWYGRPSYWVPFEDVKIIECKHECGFNDSNECFNCERKNEQS